MKYLGVDVGKVRVGIAVSDDDGGLAFPVTILSRNEAEFEILEILKERGISNVVIGESIDLKGNPNPVMKDVNEIKDFLDEQGIKTFLIPEHFSTIEAGRIGRGTDSEAAAIILQSFLDRVN